jgi:glycosyltransferase involved in cell wall biosynthesis
MPADTGNGLAMRAGVSLEALAADHEVVLLVLPIAGAADPSHLPAWAARHAARVLVLPVDGSGDTQFGLIARVRDAGARARALLQYPRPLLSRFATPRAVAEAARQLAGVSFDVVHVHRLYVAPFAAPFVAARADGRPVTVLDLDDDEPRTRRSLSALHALRGRAEAAAMEAAEADKYASFEREWLPRFDRLLVCSEADRAAAAARMSPDRIAVIPNAVRPPEPPALRQPREEFRFLLVGSFGYAPNEDAALFFAEDIWPRLVAESPRPVRAVLAGAGPTPAVVGLGRMPGIAVTGPVDTMAPCYAGADAAINPIRAGGGTRIKAIEAFAHGVPLVSTSIGAEGHDVEHERHVLIADGAADFARACLRLVREPWLGRALAEQAHALYRERYALAPVTQRLRAVYRALAATPRHG